MSQTSPADQSQARFLREVGSLVYSLRLERGLTQAELAKQLTTTQSAIARIEKGQQNLSAKMLSRLNRSLGADMININRRQLNIKIKGGRKLTGRVTTKSSKNGAVGLLCAALINRGPTVLHRVPRIEEVFRIIEVLQSIGVSVTWQGPSVTITPPAKLKCADLNTDSASKTRSIIMFLGPLAHRLKSFQLPKTGGCKLGSRSIKPHIYGLATLGVTVTGVKNYLKVSVTETTDSEVVLYEAGDTVTENILMAAARRPGPTVIKFASANYMVQEICFFLEKLGVKIEGVGTTTLTVYGREQIDQPVEYTVTEDPIESMFFLTAGLVTGSRLTVERCPIDFLELELLKLEKMGLRYRRSKKYLAFNGRTELVNLTVYPSTLTALEEKIEPRPYPGLNIDNLPFFAVIATQARGQTLLHDWVYEERAIYFKELDKLGAQTLLADPHRFYITGPTKLQANEIICPPALRPAAIILIGMLAAEGQSVLRNIYSINRGYEDIVARLQRVGAEISILSEL